MVKLGELNSRMKDFFDIWSLAASGSFDGEVLAEAIQAKELFPMHWAPGGPWMLDR